MNDIYENSTETNTCENNPEQIIVTNIQDLNNENFKKLEPNRIVNKRKYNKSIKSNKKTKIDINVDSNINEMFDNNNLLSQEYLQPYNSKDEKLNEKEKKESNDEHSPQKIEINIKDKTNKIIENRKLNKNPFTEDNCKSNLTNLCEEIEIPKDSTNMEDQKQENSKIKKKTTKRATNSSISSKNQIKNQYVEMLLNNKKNELKFNGENEIKSNLKENSKLVDFEKNKKMKTDLMDKIENSQPFLPSKNVIKGKQKTKIKNKNENLDSQLSCELMKNKSEKIKENKNKKQPKGEKIENVEIFQQIDKVVVNQKQSKKKKSAKDIQQKKDTNSQLDHLDKYNISFSSNESIPKATLLKKKDNKNQKKGNKDKILKSNKIGSSKKVKTIDVNHVDDDDILKINDKAKNKRNKKTLVKKQTDVNPTKRNLRSQNKNK